METQLDAAAARGPVAGHVPLQRLTRTEYTTAVNDLLGLELEATDLLPAEIEVNGFENIATALSVSPAFLDQYVAAARRAAKLAVGEAVPKVSSAHHVKPKGDDQAAHIDGLPLGTRGGMKFRHTFPADGEYRFTLPDLGVDLYTRVVETPHTVVVLIDGREVFRETLGGPEDMRTVDRGGAPGRAKVMERFAGIPVQVKAGTYDVAVTFVERARIESDEFVGFLPGDEFSRGDRMPRLVDGVTVMGPYNSPGVSDTPSRRRVFICRPQGNDERVCARRIAETLARRAFRRPVTAAEIESLLPYFDDGRKGRGGFDEGIEHLIAAVLVSPEFLYRGIQGLWAGSEDAARQNQGSFALSDLELASRLSFFLWSQGPDDRLLKVAASRRLTTPGVLRARSAAHAAGPARRGARAQLRAQGAGPRQAERGAAGSRISSPLSPKRCGTTWPARPSRSCRACCSRIATWATSSRPTTLSSTSGWHATTAWRRCSDRSSAASRSTTRAAGACSAKGRCCCGRRYGNRTSPVLRGAWVMGKLMGTPPTPPPPDVDTDLSNPKGAPPRTLRALLESHRSKAGCRQCHGVIDPIGLALENFDAIGRWRDMDAEAKAPIDASTELPTGQTVNGPAELRQAIFGGRDLFVRAFTEKLTMYALGRELRYYDMPQVRAVVRRAAAQDYRLSAIVSGIVTSDAFRMQARN